MSDKQNFLEELAELRLQLEDLEEPARKYRSLSEWEELIGAFIDLVASVQDSPRE